MPLPKVIFFDWNKTLCHSRFWEQLEDADHPGHEDGKKIAQYLFQDHRDLLKVWMRGELATDMLLQDIGNTMHVDFNFVKHELETSCRKMEFIFPDIPNVIRELQRKGMLCVIATDNMDTFRQYTMEHMNLAEIFDDFLLSNELGTLKFDKDPNNKGIPFFDAFLAKHGLQYKDAVLIDDCVDDGTYAQKGFRILHATSPEIFREYLDQLKG